MRRPNREDIVAEIESLQHWDREALKSKWVELYRVPPPHKAGQEFLRKAIAYRIQEKAYGGLKPATVRQLKRLADELAAGRRPQLPASRPVLQLGARLIREWNSQTHVVEVTPKGLLWRGRYFKSLSAIAAAITGAKWSGPRFFGLGDKAAAERPA